MDWKKEPKCSNLEPVFSPKNNKEADFIFSIHKLEKSIYTDFRRVNQSIFYRNTLYTVRRIVGPVSDELWVQVGPVNPQFTFICIYHIEKASQEIYILMNLHIMKLPMVNIGQGSPSLIFLVSSLTRPYYILKN